MPLRFCWALFIASALWGQKFDPRFTDPRIGVLNFKAAGDGRFEFDLVNRYSAHLVGWMWRSPQSRTTIDAGQREIGCGAGLGTIETIEPGGMRHETTSVVPCGRGGKIHHFSAIYSDGTWVGPWSDLEDWVKTITIRRLVLQRWLVSLGALSRDPEPFAKVVELMTELDRMPKRLDGPSTPTGIVPDWYAHEEMNFSAQSYLGYLVRRCYEHLLGLDTRADPRKRDRKAEETFLARADAKRQTEDGLAREIETVDGDIYDLAWVTLIGPKGERIGPEIPPPPPRIKTKSPSLIPRGK